MNSGVAAAAWSRFAQATLLPCRSLRPRNRRGERGQGGDSPGRVRQPRDGRGAAQLAVLPRSPDRRLLPAPGTPLGWPSSTFRTPRSAARAKAWGAAASGKRSETRALGRTAPLRSSSSAGSNRPQREPISVISWTTAAETSNAASPCTVDFRMTTPRGRVMASASRRPSAEPVASTTHWNAARGGSSAISVETPAASAMRSLAA